MKKRVLWAKKKKFKESLAVKYGLIPLAFLFIGACFSGRDRIREDIFNLQTRLLQVEHRTKAEVKVNKTLGESSNKRIATTSLALEQLQNDVLRIKGDMEAVKIGFRNGKLPGDPENAPSIALIMNTLSERISEIEETQTKILDLIDSKSKEKQKKKRQTLKTAASIRKAFADKRYKHIAEDLPKQLRRFKGNVLHEMKFIFSESLFKLGKLREAALAYDDLIKMKAIPSKMPKMQLRMGDCFRYLGDSQTALVYYNELIENHPQSSEATKASKYIAKLQEVKPSSRVKG